MAGSLAWCLACAGPLGVAYGAASGAACELDMNAADSTVNAPCKVDSEFVVQAARQLARFDLSSDRALGLHLSSLQRQKGWTLPPPDVALYRRPRPVLGDAGSLHDERARRQQLVRLFEAEAHDGNDSDLRKLAHEALPFLQQELASLQAPGALRATG